MIYITSDTHREMDIWKINPDDGFPIGKTLTKDDYLIICGDFGCIWDGASGDEFWLKWLSSLPWTTIFIDGNHENFDLLNNYPIEQWHGGLIHRIRHNIVHLMRGEIYNIDGYSFLAFGGGYSHDGCYRTEHMNWWKDELPTASQINQMNINLMNAQWRVDYVISHDVFRSNPLTNRFFVDLTRYGGEYFNVQDVLEEIRSRLNYKVWFHGHYHQDLYDEYDGKPCICLFNKVIPLENTEQMKKHFE